MKSGDTFERIRTFTNDDIRVFAEVSRDFGEHHVEPDAEGRLMAQGLLTASLCTEIGGSIDYIARDMNFAFKRPVWGGDTITCTATLDEVDEQEHRFGLIISFEFTNQHGDLVLVGTSSGIVRK